MMLANRKVQRLPLKPATSAPAATIPQRPSTAKRPVAEISKPASAATTTTTAQPPARASAGPATKKIRAASAPVITKEQQAAQDADLKRRALEKGSSAHWRTVLEGVAGMTTTRTITMQVKETNMVTGKPLKSGATKTITYTFPILNPKSTYYIEEKPSTTGFSDVFLAVKDGSGRDVYGIAPQSCTRSPHITPTLIKTFKPNKNGAGAQKADDSSNKKDWKFGIDFTTGNWPAADPRQALVLAEQREFTHMLPHALFAVMTASCIKFFDPKSMVARSHRQKILEDAASAVALTFKVRPDFSAGARVVLNRCGETGQDIEKHAHPELYAEFMKHVVSSFYKAMNVNVMYARDLAKDVPSTSTSTSTSSVTEVTADAPPASASASASAGANTSEDGEADGDDAAAAADEEGDEDEGCEDEEAAMPVADASAGAMKTPPLRIVDLVKKKPEEIPEVRMWLPRSAFMRPYDCVEQLAIPSHLTADTPALEVIDAMTKAGWELKRPKIVSSFTGKPMQMPKKLTTTIIGQNDLVRVSFNFHLGSYVAQPLTLSLNLGHTIELIKQGVPDTQNASILGSDYAEQTTFEDDDDEDEDDIAEGSAAQEGSENNATANTSVAQLSSLPPPSPPHSAPPAQAPVAEAAVAESKTDAMNEDAASENDADEVKFDDDEDADSNDDANDSA